MLQCGSEATPVSQVAFAHLARTEPSPARSVAPSAEPPYSNRGVYPPISEDGPYPVCKGLDAYNATVFANPDALFDDLTCLLASHGHVTRPMEGPKVRFYARNLLLVDQFDKRLLQVRAGGQNPHPFVECKGEVASIVAGFLRAQYDHRPARIDHADDAERDFDQLVDVMRSIAKRYRIKGRLITDDEHDPDAGATYYLGSRASQVFVRAYQKGLKYAREAGIPVTDELRRWVRIEIEFKPQNRLSRALAATITPDQMWGATRWTQELAQEVLKMPTNPVTIRERRESDRDRALRFCCSQYSAHLESLLEECEGDLGEFAETIINLAGIDLYAIRMKAAAEARPIPISPRIPQAR